MTQKKYLTADDFFYNSAIHGGAASIGFSLETLSNSTVITSTSGTFSPNSLLDANVYVLPDSGLKPGSSLILLRLERRS